MAGSRTLKLSILAETADLVKGLNSAEQSTATFGDKVEAGFSKVGKAALLAGAAIATLAAKLAIDGVQAAIDDEEAQAKLAATLEKVTDATDAQIASVEEYISQTALAVGVTDEELRPSFDRLLRSVRDVDKAIALQTLALDVSAGTGKNLSQVTEALARAYDGNFGSLKRLGGGIDESIIKNKDFDAAVVALSDTFGGRAEVAAGTYRGRLERVKIALDEAKESIGFALLPSLEGLSKFMVNQGTEALQAFINGLTGKEGLKPKVQETSPKVAELQGKLTDVEDAAYAAGTALNIMGKRVGEMFEILDLALGGEGSGMAGFLKLMRLIEGAIEGVSKAIKALIELVPKLGRAFGDGFQKMLEFLTTLRKGFFGDFTPPNVPQQFNRSSFTVPSTSNLGMASGGANYITVNGAIDPEGTARTIIDVLNNSQSRGTLGAGALVF